MTFFRILRWVGVAVSGTVLLGLNPPWVAVPPGQVARLNVPSYWEFTPLDAIAATGNGRVWIIKRNGDFLALDAKTQESREGSVPWVPPDIDLYKQVVNFAGLKELQVELKRLEQGETGQKRTIADTTASTDSLFLLYLSPDSLLHDGILQVDENMRPVQFMPFVAVKPLTTILHSHGESLASIAPLSIQWLPGDLLAIAQIRCEFPPILVLDWKSKTWVGAFGTHPNGSCFSTSPEGPHRGWNRPYLAPWKPEGRLVALYPYGPDSRMIAYDIRRGVELWDVSLRDQISPHALPGELTDEKGYSDVSPRFICPVGEREFLLRTSKGRLFIIDADGRLKLYSAEPQRGVLQCQQDARGRPLWVRRGSNGQDVLEFPTP
jgi:hypothetical protein